MSSESYRNLEVWKVAFVLATNIYKLAGLLPRHETYGLISQIKRAAVFIPSNIAEGQQRSSRKEFQRFLFIARGSAAELATQLQLVKVLYNVDVDEQLSITDRVQKMLYGLIRSV